MYRQAVETSAGYELIRAVVHIMAVKAMKICIQFKSNFINTHFEFNSIKMKSKLKRNKDTNSMYKFKGPKKCDIVH